MRRLRPLILDRYVALRMLNPFCQGVAMFLGLLLALDTVRRALDFYQSGSTALAAVELFLYSIPQYLVLSLPMAMLFAGIFTFGQLSSDGELTAAASSGVSFRRLVVPALAFAMLVSIFGFWVSEMVAPWCNRRVADLRATVAPSGGSHGAMNRLWRDLDANGRLAMIVFAAEYDASMSSLRGVTLLRYEYDEDGAVREIYLTLADEARYRGSYTWELRGAVTKQTLSKRPMTWEETEIRLYRPPTQIARLDLEARTLTVSMLRDEIARLRQTLEATGWKDSEAELMLNTDATELALRFAVPLACLIFAMAGCPMGVRPERTTRGMSYGLSFGIILLYYIIVNYMTRLGYKGDVPPWVAAWAANAVLAGVGIVLIVRVPQ